MQMKKWLALGLLVPALGLGGLALAEPDGPRGARGGPGGAPWGHIVSQLELTPEQEALVAEFKDEGQAHREAMRAEREANRETIKAQLGSGRPDAAVLHALVTKQSEVRAAHAHERLDDFLALYATLTPDQLAQVRQILEEGPARRGEGMGPQGPGGEPGRRHRR